jgi:Spy/CpxP family protein refolding chaperone
MKLNKTLAIIAIAATGLFAGNALQAQDAPKDKPADAPAGGPGGPGGMRRPPLSADALAKQLDLTDDQKTKIKPILEEMQKKMADFRKDAASLAPEDRRAKMKEIRDGVTAKLKEILTAEQLAKWEKMGPGNRRPPGGAGGPPPAATEGDKANKN